MTRGRDWKTVSSRSERSKSPAHRAGGTRASSLGPRAVLLFSEAWPDLADMRAVVPVGKGFPRLCSRCFAVMTQAGVFLTVRGTRASVVSASCTPGLQVSGGCSKDEASNAAMSDLTGPPRRQPLCTLEMGLTLANSASSTSIRSN